MGSFRRRPMPTLVAARRMIHQVQRFASNNFKGAIILVLGLGLLLALITAFAIALPGQVQRKHSEQKPVFLILGGGGFIGMHLSLALRNEGFRVYAIDMPSPKGITFTRTMKLIASGVKHIPGNLLDAGFATTTMKNIKPSIIVDLTQHERYGSNEVNMRLMSNALHAAAGAGSVQRFFFSSPNRFYMDSSRSAEKLVREQVASMRLGFSVTEWRFSTVYGPFGRPDMDYFRFSRGIFDGSEVLVGGNGVMDYQDYIHVDDAVEIMRSSMLLPSKALLFNGTNIVDVGTGRAPVSFYDVFHALEKVIHMKMRYKFLPTSTVGPLEVGPVEVPYVEPAYLMRVKPEAQLKGLMLGLQEFVTWYHLEYYGLKRSMRRKKSGRALEETKLWSRRRSLR